MNKLHTKNTCDENFQHSAASTVRTRATRETKRKRQPETFTAISQTEDSTTFSGTFNLVANYTLYRQPSV